MHSHWLHWGVCGAVLADRCFHVSGVPHSGALSGDGLLHVVQSDRRDDCAVHRSGAFAVPLDDHSLQC